MKYFLHDTNSFQDEKITELFIEHGYEGLGLFYTILEKLALQEKPIKTVVLKRQLEVNRKLEKIWNFLEEIGLIISKNGETFNENILKFSGKYQTQKETNRDRVRKFREQQAQNQQVTDSVTHYSDVTEPLRNAPKEKKSKVKESKVNTSVADASQSGEVFNFVKSEFLAFYKHNFKEDYYFTGVDGKKIKTIIKKVGFKVREKSGVEPTELELGPSVMFFISEAYRTANDWLRSHFNLSNLDSQFNELFIQIKNGKNTANNVGSGRNNTRTGSTLSPQQRAYNLYKGDH